jgi:hypothetical protein
MRKARNKKREAQNVAERFRKHAEAYFQFITTPGMDPTNNVAEQAIRFIVIDRHVTQGTRSAKGRRANERLWTVIATCALQGARPSSLSSRPCRRISTIAIRPLYSPTLLDKLPMLEGLLPAPCSKIRAPLPSVATDVSPKTLAVD